MSGIIEKNNIRESTTGDSTMTHEDRGHYAKKHPSERKVKPEIAEEVKLKASEEGVPCATAHKIAQDLKVEPSEIGFTMDALEIPIAKCQLGLFGYTPQKKIVKPADSVSKELEKVLRRQVKNGKIPCRSVWDTAEKFGLAKMKVSAACDALDIKISPCQLGAF